MTRLGNGDGTIEDHQDKWELYDAADSVAVPEDELEQLSRDLLRAVERAKTQTAQAPGKPRPFLRLRFAMAAVMLAAGLVVISLLVCLDFDVLVAAPLDDIQGLVVDEATGKPLAGVRIRLAVKLDDGTGYAPPHYIGTTDLSGFFQIPRGVDAPAGICSFFVDNQEVATFEIDAAEQAVDTGLVKIRVGRPEHLEARPDSHPVDLIPGAACPIGKLTVISLGEDSPGEWHGAFINDLEWPVAFNLAHVLGGIYRLAGTDSVDLSITVGVSGEELASHGSGPDRITLIAFDEDYSREQTLEAEYHHGWYDASRPPAGVGQPPTQPQVTLREGDYTVSWSTVPGLSYALILSPQCDGVFSPCFVPGSVDGQAVWDKWVCLGEKQYPQMSLYDLDYLPGDGSPATAVNTQPKYPFFNLQINTTHRYRYEPRMREPITNLNDIGPVPGKFILKCSSFLVTDVQSYPPLVLDYPDPGKGYAIKVTKRPIGQKTKLQITGDLRAAAQINWDIDEDYVTDMTGQSIEILVPYACGFNATATVITRTARYVVSVPLAYYDEKIIGFINRTNGPVIRGVAASPREPSQFVTMTPSFKLGRMCYGYSASCSLGPALLVTPADSWRNRKLQTMRIHLFGSPMAGECAAVYLSPMVSRLVDATGPVPNIRNTRDFITGNADFVDTGLSNLSADVDRALRRYHAGGSFRDYFADRLETDFNITKQTSFIVSMGLDVTDLPAEAEVLRILTEFKDSPDYARRYLTEDNQELIWNVDLHDMVLSGAEGLLVNISTETQGLLNEAQWELYSGGNYPARVELIDEDGEIWTTYYDLGLLQ